ncbi:hypothetical protein BCR39DRAFT_554100 [Naematelia encephala]|uniref:Zn(2)-C6 fungal-type domain-containing protein n=1 Tax=Naematelia encephala TaxID=71784 RepID=A0A1Y2AG84_9TREE|nr:hypothetical protein BCR39DRAFT_554100 [Naematelia encephala]
MLASWLIYVHFLFRDATGFASFSLASSLWDQSQDTLEKYSDVLARFARRRGSLDTALDIRRRTVSVMNSQGLFRTLVAGNEHEHHHENSLPSLEEELFEDAVEIPRGLQAELPEDFVFEGDVHLEIEPELSLADLPSSQVDFEPSSETLTNACRNCVTRKIDCVRPTEGGITCLQCRKAKISCQYEEEYSTKRRTMLEAAIRDLDQMIRLREARFDKRDLTGRRVLRDLIGVAQINRISVTKSENAKTGLGIGDEALAKSALSHLLEICQDVDYQLCK